MAVARPQPTDVAAQLMRMVLDHNADALSSSYMAVGELFVDHHARLEELWNAGPETYIHGDAHIGNVFLDRGRVGFVDWACHGVSTHLRDISYFLTMTVDPLEHHQDRRDLLRLYLHAVRAAGGTHSASTRRGPPIASKPATPSSPRSWPSCLHTPAPKRKLSVALERAANWPSTNSRSSTPYGRRSLPEAKDADAYPRSATH